MFEQREARQSEVRRLVVVFGKLETKVDGDRQDRLAERREDDRITGFQQCGGGRRVLRKKIGGE